MTETPPTKKRPPISPEALAERLSISNRAARRMVQSGEIKAFRIGRLWRVEEEDYESYVAELKKRAAKEQAARAAPKEGA